jgi:RimJ/RimL family protein N-acetyltransferase
VWPNSVLLPLHAINPGSAQYAEIEYAALPVNYCVFPICCLATHFTIQPAMHAIYSDAEATWFIPRGARDYAGTHQRVTDLIDHLKSRGVSKWAVTLGDSGLLIGDCGPQFLPERPDLALGFHFARQYRGLGDATEAATACLAWALNNRAERILAIVDPATPPRNGF